MTQIPVAQVEMESLSKLKQRLAPADRNADVINEAQTEARSSVAEPNDDPEKPSQQLEVAGIAKLEAAQAVWGKTGKYFLYLG